jgi:hypothetical protein
MSNPWQLEGRLLAFEKYLREHAKTETLTTPEREALRILRDELIELLERTRRSSGE